MPILNCSVSTCAYNSDDCCCRSGIQVDGRSACCEDETCCVSFDSRREGSCTNRADTPKSQLVVDCQAVECMFNKDLRCGADHIGIAGREAKNSCDTECSSFRAK